MAKALVEISERCMELFEELYVVSDLHIGGAPGFQIFDSGAELVRLVDHLRTFGPDRSVGLVVNGDFVDFLADEDPTHFDPATAAQKLDRVMIDPAFAPIWEALRRFADTPNRRLLINLGNHDIELGLPWVRAYLLDRLSANDAARGRIVFSVDGSGFLCRVGQARILCVHGNEVDLWNLVDYEAIRRIGRDVSRGVPVEPWIPNAGTQLVIDVMNTVKKAYPFVDLLKPEMRAVIPTLLAVAPEHADKVAAVLAVLARREWDRVRQGLKFLSSEPDREAPEAALAPTAAWPGPPDTDALLLQAEEWLHDDVDPLSLLGDAGQDRHLRLGQDLLQFIGMPTKAEALRKALQRLKADRGFALDEPDDTYKALDEQIGDSVDFIIAGHTHLERSLKRRRRRGWYFNSGTWARLIRLDETMLESESRFAAAFQAFTGRSIQALDAMPDLVMRRRTVVAIWQEGGCTMGELRRVETGADAVLTPVPDSRSVAC